MLKLFCGLAKRAVGRRGIVKPYVPAFDLVQGAVIPEYMERLMEGYF